MKVRREFPTTSKFGGPLWSELNQTWNTKKNIIIVQTRRDPLIDAIEPNDSSTFDSSQWPSSLQHSATLSAYIESEIYTCFFNRATTNLSKSDNPLRFSLTVFCLAYRVFSNFVSTSAAAHFFATVPVRAPLGNLGKTTGRRVR
jgi:hypothetical protein